jgi:lipoteichoic acid synthase
MNFLIKRDISYQVKILCYGFAMLPVLFLTRGRIQDYEYSFIFTAPEFIPRTLWASVYDFSCCGVLTLFFIVAGRVFRNKRKVRPFMLKLFPVVLNLMLVLAVVNIRIVQLIGAPLNWQWVYYADFGTAGSMSSIQENLSVHLFAELVLLSLLLYTTSVLLRGAYVSYKRHFPEYRRIILISGLGLGLLYFLRAYYITEKRDLSYRYIANPAFAFVQSVAGGYGAEHKLFTLKVPDTLPPFRSVAYRKISLPEQTRVKNVIFFVLESVPARYISAYSGRTDVTPNIHKYQNASLIISDAYAHMPATNSSLVSILGSVYPMISYRFISKEFPDMDWPTVSSELKRKNYSTGFFHASDNRYQNIGEFLSYRRFDRISDFTTIRCSKNVLKGSTKEWKYLDGVDEECMIDDFSKWLSGQKIQQPFFVTLWTAQTHYPYFASGKEKNFRVKDKNLNRYLNALSYSDQMFGQLMDILKKRGLYESTLVVIAGDHGEAFGEHRQMGHAVHLYEENIRVPLILINPGLFHGQRLNSIAGHVDIAPTVFDLLGIDSPDQWQGHSLLDSGRVQRTFFFNPRTDYLIGYRTGRYKVIFNYTDQKPMVFDLEKDPGELSDIAEQMPELVMQSEFRLAQWVQYHEGVLKKVLR